MECKVAGCCRHARYRTVIFPADRANKFEPRVFLMFSLFCGILQVQVDRRACQLASWASFMSCPDRDRSISRSGAATNWAWTFDSVAAAW